MSRSGTILVNDVCELSCSVVSHSLRPHGLYLARFLCSWGFSRQGYWSGLPCPPPGDLPNPGIEPRSPTLQVDLYCLNHWESPRTLEWVAYPFSRGMFWPRSQTGVSCIASRFFTSWATREALESNQGLLNCRQILHQRSYQESPASGLYWQTSNWWVSPWHGPCRLEESKTVTWVPLPSTSHACFCHYFDAFCYPVVPVAIGNNATLPFFMDSLCLKKK